jgi:hypothetical protein
MDSILLRIIIFVIFCLIGLGMVNLVGSRSVSSKKELTPSIKVENFKKFPSVKDECKEGICPEPEINEVSEELIRHSMKLLRESDNGNMKNNKERR